MKTLAFVLLGSVSGLGTAGNYTAESIDAYLEPIRARHTTEADKRGLEIYTQQYLTDEGWGDTDAEMDMLLVDALGRESRRKVIKRTLEDGDAPDKTLGIFLEPADVKGTVMLTFEQSYGPDEQWLFLPALKRTKKINAENKSGSFLGTEFSWEDISTTELTKYQYTYLDEDDKHWIVQRVPVYKFSGYSKEITWVDKSNSQTVKIEFYDRKGDLLKTEVMGEWEQYKDRYWRPRYFEMVNHQNKKKTVLHMSPYRFGSELDARMFSSLGLSRVSLGEAR